MESNKTKDEKRKKANDSILVNGGREEMVFELAFPGTDHIFPYQGKHVRVLVSDHLFEHHHGSK